MEVIDISIQILRTSTKNYHYSDLFIFFITFCCISPSFIRKLYVKYTMLQIAKVSQIIINTTFIVI